MTRLVPTKPLFDHGSIEKRASIIAWSVAVSAFRAGRSPIRPALEPNQANVGAKSADPGAERSSPSPKPDKPSADSRDRLGNIGMARDHKSRGQSALPDKGMAVRLPTDHSAKEKRFRRTHTPVDRAQGHARLKGRHMELPKELRTHLFVRATNGGNIEYGIARLEEVQARSLAPAKLAALVAVQFLHAARDAHDRTGKPEPGEADILLATAIPTTSGIYHLPNALEQIVLCFGFSGPILGISLDRETAKTLAMDILAMTAGGQPN